MLCLSFSFPELKNKIVISSYLLTSVNFCFLLLPSSVIFIFQKKDLTAREKWFHLQVSPETVKQTVYIVQTGVRIFKEALQLSRSSMIKINNTI